MAKYNVKNDLFISVFLSLFLVASTTISSQPAKYIWKPTTNMDETRNWAGNSVPCEDDIVVFDQGKVVATYLPGDLKTSEILLPDDGVIFMDKYTILGEKADWQCAKREESLEASFSPVDDLPNIYDYRNWIVEGPGASHRPLLHSERIPSKMVIYNSESKKQDSFRMKPLSPPIPLLVSKSMHRYSLES